MASRPAAVGAAPPVGGTAAEGRPAGASRRAEERAAAADGRNGAVTAVRVPPLVEPGPPLTRDEVERYSRHLLLPALGRDGQRRLRAARVCVIGAGGLGAPVLLYLAAAGVGRLGIVDFDDVAVSNLQRQVVHGRSDVGRPKLDSARDAVLAVDPDLDVVLHDVRLTRETVDDVLRGYDLVVDGTDNFATRYLVNDSCVRLGLAEVWGSVLRFDAQVSVFWGRPPASSGVPPVQLRDLFPSPPPAGSVPSCGEAGVLGALCGQVGTVMATEAVKLITGAGEPLLGRVLVLDGLAARWSEVRLQGGGRAADDAVLAEDAALAEDAVPADARPADDALHVDQAVPTLSPRELADALAGVGAGEVAGEGRDPGLVVVDVREPEEREIVVIAGSRSVPLARILTGEALPELPRDRRLVLYCRSGARSERAARALAAAGFTQVAHLAGGVLAWVDAVEPSAARY